MENENFGLSPRSDSGWYYQQMREHNPEQWDALIQSDLEVLRMHREGSFEDDFNPYDDMARDELPLAHSQLLPHLGGKVDPRLIFEIGQGNFDAIDRIEDAQLREWTGNRCEQLLDVGAWEVPEIDLPTTRDAENEFTWMEFPEF